MEKTICELSLNEIETVVGGVSVLVAQAGKPGTTIPAKSAANDKSMGSLPNSTSATAMQWR